jgi:lipopolysaccharide cholinephosphotransferase
MYVELLIFIDKVCNKHDIDYWLGFGTLLGAVRHGGFIPWDDDIDVHMPRKDYEKLYQLFSGKTIDKFFLENYRNGNKDFIYTYTKRVCLLHN